MWYNPIGSSVALILSMLAVPLVAAAQPVGPVHRIGWLSAGSLLASRANIKALQQGLRDLGYVEGQNLAIEYRYADGQFDRLPALVAELVRFPVDVLVAGGENVARVAQHVTHTLPIVVVAGVDPVEVGLIASLARPGGNITGLSLISTELGGKRLELLKEAVPTASRVAVLFNPANSSAVSQWREIEGTARALGVQLHAIEVRQADELERAFAIAASEGAGALIVFRDFFIETHRTQILHLAAQRRLPAIAWVRTFAEGGLLMTYGPDELTLYRRTAYYVDRILKGIKPADLPVEQPTKFEFVINLTTAQALGVTMPPSLLILADEVIK